MSGEANLVGYYFQETVLFTVLAKERDGTILLSPATAVMIIRIADNASSDSIYSFNTTPEVEMTDVGTSEFTIALPAATIPLVFEDTEYRYDIYTVSPGGDRLHQIGGALRLRPSVEA